MIGDNHGNHKSTGSDLNDRFLATVRNLGQTKLVYTL